MRVAFASVAVVSLVFASCGGSDARDPSVSARGLPHMDSALWEPVEQGELDRQTQWELARHRTTERRCERFLVFPTGDADPGSIRSASKGLMGCSDDGGPVFDDPPVDVACSLLMQFEDGPEARWPFSRAQLRPDPCAEFDFARLSLRTRRAGNISD